MIKCPVCKGATGGYRWPEPTPEAVMERLADRLAWIDMPLYQFSYPDQPEYISPRCLRCLEKARKKAKRKELNRTCRLLKLNNVW